jgi:carbonic anhydrase/acetyltransferase-like protein (isoleucine patch superfamily)
MALYSLDGIVPSTPAAGRFWVAPNATIVGNVEIGEDASVWFGAVVRGDLDVIRIGNGSNIQDGAVLHTDPGLPLTLGANCTVGHMAMVHGCTVGAGSLIGIGAIVLNAAVIGEECLVGAGTLVPEGKTFAPRSLIIGTPGRVVRQLGEDDIARMRKTAAGYQQRWKRYVAGFEKLVE